MQAFNKEQQHYLKTLLNDAMASAAVSFGGMLGIDVLHDHLQVFITQGETKVYPCFKTDAQVVMVVTPLIGDLPGKSFFILDRSDVNAIMKENPMKGSGLSQEIMKETLLKEIDNVISASFVTTLANRLGTSVFGDVPELHNQSPTIANDLIHQYGAGDVVSVVCQSAFVSAQYSSFNPQFIWKFNAPVLQRSIVRAVATVGNG